MDQFMLIALLVVVLVVALIVFNRGVRSWVIRFFGIESRVQGHRNITRIRAEDSKVRKIANKDGSIDINARQGSEIEDVRNE